MAQTNETSRQIEEALHAAGIGGLPEDAIGRLAAYLDLLLRWNARLNLTSIRTPEEMIDRHLVECAFAAQHIPPGINTLLDFGSGAGLPGIPIAICRPEIHVTLSESRAKKAAFLAEAVRVLGIASEIYRGRVEQMPAGRGFDAVVMRAVDKMKDAVMAARPRAEHVLALMTTAPAASEYPQLAPEFSWRRPIRLPNTGKAILLVGER